MQQTQNKQHLFFVYICFSAVFFVLGLTLTYILPYNSFIYSRLELSLLNSVTASPFSLSSIASDFSSELKYVLFVTIAAFTTQRHKLFALLASYKSAVTGICSACLMRAVKLGNLNVNYEIFGCFVFVSLSVMLICVLCQFCSIAFVFSKKMVYPLRIKTVIKRKDTYLFLFDILALSGLIFLIIILKQGNFYFMIS